MRRSHRTGLLRLGLVPGLAFLGQTALGCGFEDPGSAMFQRGALSLAYTNSLHVIGAVTQARMDGILESNARGSEAKDMFAFQRTAKLLQRFGTEQAGGRNGVEGAVFSLVLIEPMLWTRFSVRGADIETSVHVAGPDPGGPVIVTSEAVLKALVDHKLTGRHAMDLGLLRIYGDARASMWVQAWIAEVYGASHR